MDWISDRELGASIVILSVTALLVWVPSSRWHVFRIVRAAFHHQMILLAVGISLSAGLTLAVFEPDVGWTSRQLWLSLLWVALVGFPIAAGIIQRFGEARWDVVTDEISRRLSPTLILSLVASYRSFSVWIEVSVIAVMILLTLGVIGSLKNSTEEHKDRMMSMITRAGVFFGLVFLVFSTASIIRSPEPFFRRETAVDFVVPFVLTSAFLVYGSLLFLYVTYYDTAVRAGLYIRDDKLRRYAVRSAFLSFGTNVEALKRWMRVLALERPDSRQEIDRSLVAAREISRPKKADQ